MTKEKSDKVLIITSKSDIHADAVLNELKKRGVDVFRLNTEDLFAKYQYKLKISNNGDNIISFFDNFNRSFTIGSRFDVVSIYYRKPSDVNLDVKDNNLKKFIIDETKELLKYIYFCKNIKWVNNPLQIQQAGIKWQQLELAKKIGFLIPDTLITSSKKDIKVFFLKHNKEIIFKSLKSQSISYGNHYYLTRTFKPTEKKFFKLIDNVGACPVFVQNYIKKQIELRIIVIKNFVYAVSIDSQNSINGIIDWRRENINKINHKIFCLPKKIEKMCVKFIEEQGLLFGAIDMIVTQDNEYVFLENNPNGQWYWLEILTGIPLVNRMVDLLINKI